MSAPGFEVDFWVPDSRLEGLVSGYHRYAAALPLGAHHHDVFFPAWANLRFHTHGTFWNVRIGTQLFDVPRAALFGPTSHAGYSENGAGTVVGIGITPLGWHRLTRADAAAFADRVVPLDQLLPAAGEALLAAANLPPDEVKSRFDTILLGLMAKARSDECRIVQIHRDLMEPYPGDVSEMADRLGLSHRTLNRIALSAFGFGPKLLIRRARFLRSLMAITDATAETWASRIEESYYDHSHFNRDAQEFLGMPPGRFLRLPKPLNDASARLRTKILGAPAQALLRPRLTEAP